MVVKTAPDGLMKLAEEWCQELFENLEDPRVFICGGFIRSYYLGERPSDMDIYFQSKETEQHTIEILTKFYGKPSFETDRAATFINKGKMIQAIKILHGSHIEILKEFDFTICKAILNYYDRILYLDDNFFEHLASRILIFTGSKYPISSLSRAFKFVKRGFHICDGCILDIVKAISDQVDFKNPEILQEHLDGIDPNGFRIRVID